MFEGTSYYLTEPVKDSNKPIVVCVHGIGTWSGDFDGLTSELESINYNVLKYDLIGRGNSEFPVDKIFDGPSHVFQLRKLIEGLEINLKKYHIVGHSMGGALVTLYCAQFGEEIESITLLSPAGLMSLGALRVLRSFPHFLLSPLKASMLRNQDNAFRNGFVVKTGDELVNENKYFIKIKEVYKANPYQFESLWKSILQFPLSKIEKNVEKIVEFEIPTFLMFGKKDKLVPCKENNKKWMKILKKSTKNENKVYDGLGHSFYIENPELVLPDILAFIKKNT
jgi:pimeloyl-ACP methyl ester carboxylesterase